MSYLVCDKISKAFSLVHGFYRIEEAIMTYKTFWFHESFTQYMQAQLFYQMALEQICLFTIMIELSSIVLSTSWLLPIYIVILNQCFQIYSFSVR